MILFHPLLQIASSISSIWLFFPLDVLFMTEKSCLLFPLFLMCVCFAYFQLPSCTTYPVSFGDYIYAILTGLGQGMGGSGKYRK
jgi:hypothetical protein